jgi:hypothetical protein
MNVLPQFITQSLIEPLKKVYIVYMICKFLQNSTETFQWECQFENHLKLSIRHNIKLQGHYTHTEIFTSVDSNFLIIAYF